VSETFIQPFHADSPELFPNLSSCVVDDVEDSSTWPVWSAPGNRMLFEGTVKQSSNDPTVVPFLVARILVDTGCDGMVMSESFARANGIPVYPVKSKIVSMADDSRVDFSNQCTVRIRVANFQKEVTFAVGPIAEDVIFGLPFFSNIIIRNSDWKNHRFSFVSRSGTFHQWYGSQHRICKNGVSPVYLCTLQEFERERHSSDTFRVNVNRIMDMLNKEDDPDTSSNSSNLDEFMQTLDSDLAEILEPFVDNVFSEPPDFEDIPVFSKILFHSLLILLSHCIA
jgi:hypothetical protein